ncbi:hypothetical protein AAY473_015447 [Plecturocebus cupreus]
MNYAVLSTITQGKEENPTDFLETSLLCNQQLYLEEAPEAGPGARTGSRMITKPRNLGSVQARRNRKGQRKAAALVMALRQADPRGSNEGKAWPNGTLYKKLSPEKRTTILSLPTVPM